MEVFMEAIGGFMEAIGWIKILGSPVAFLLSHSLCSPVLQFIITI